MSANLATDMPVITVRELMQKLQAATERMSVTNPHRELMFQCGQAICELQKRARQSQQQLEALQKAAAAVLEQEEKAQRRVELVTL